MCFEPISLFSITHEKKDKQIYVPCGRCPECLYKSYQEWITRLECAAQDCDISLFVTFTYDDDHLPSDGVSVDDVDVLLSNIRNYMTNNKKEKVNYKYYLISEYGTDYKRPHYHALFFMPFKKDLFLIEDYRKFFYEMWRKGRVDTKDVCPERIAYVALFHNRLSNNEYSIPPGSNPVFRRYSKGLGKLYFKHKLERGCNQQICRPASDFRRVPRSWRVQAAYHEQNAYIRKMQYRTEHMSEKDKKTPDSYTNFINRFKKKHN